MLKHPIFMDYHSTTPADPRVVAAMLPFFSERFGNPASRHHSFGWEAEQAVEIARRQISALIGAQPEEIIFTSGATESDNLALKGAAAAYASRGDHIITAATEHKAVLDVCRRLEQQGFRVTYLPVSADGLLDPDAVGRAITSRTILISIMYANNEIGVIQPIRQIGGIAREHGLIFHTDATQAVGRVPIDVDADNIDLLSLSGHKIYGPKGVGVLYVRRRNRRVELVAQIDGGGHEGGLRSGTLNVPAIVGLGEACRICRDEMAAEGERLGRLRDRLLAKLQGALEGVYINGSMERRLPNNLNLSFAWVDGQALLMGLRDVAVSSGSACSSASPEPSHVLKALGVGPERLQAAIRFGLGRFNTEEEVDYVAGRVIETVRKLRDLSPLYELARSGLDLKQAQAAASEQPAPEEDENH